jgi:pilus assembly protein CpaE
VKIALISRNAAYLEEVRQFMQTQHPTMDVTTVHGDGDRIIPAADQFRPDVLLVDGVCEDDQCLASLEQAIPRHPSMAVIMVCQNQSADFLMKAMRTGVREVLPLPAKPANLADAIDRVRKRAVSAAAPRTKGKVMAFIPCKGGSGATFLAANLGYALAQENKKVALIDLNLQFGDAFVFVSDRPAPFNLSDVVNHIQRLDASFLASSMIQVLPNFGVLAAPEEPEKAITIKPDHIELLLNMAVDHYDYVILDIGRVLDAVSIKAMDHANMIFPVLQLTLPFVRDAKRLMSVFHSLGYPDDRITMIANRFQKGGEIGLADVERTVGLPVSRTVPNSFATVAASINQGIPILKLAPRDPVSKALQAMAHDLTQKTGQQQSGWLKSFLPMRA